ncbi:probable proline--tRNA ligase, mitochondrial [Culicoides brevitarsis]|uniref:probable proline--tRNA ligase, mitochondrial n=1 Tax=Culicoides brevitarsis TaxID=469753 RepID=UPI00307B37E6
MNKVSKIFQPLLITPKNAKITHTELTSKSQKLMLEMGLIRSGSNGMFHLMPLLQKSVEKCISLIDESMGEIGGQKMTMPTLTPSELWKKSGRYDTAATELLKVIDRHGKESVLSPTHEEAITALLATISPVSYRSLPLLLYQITPKFRDELKPRFGLLRTKEFLMKDLYTFDTTLDKAKETYDIVNGSYEKLFHKLNVPFCKVSGDTGIMGGSLSHEYHFPAAIGEDSLLTCGKCSYSCNAELSKDSKNCPKCSSSDFRTTQGIEIAHSFVLEDKYTKSLKATYLMSNGKPSPLIMGCYGIGVTRLVAAALEVLSSENELRWPYKLAPFNICLVPPKSGSKEETPEVKNLCEMLEREINNFAGKNFLVDDRTTFTIGKRLLEAKRMGYPFIIVVGEKSNSEKPLLEFHDLMENDKKMLEPNELLTHLKAKIKSFES